MTFLCISISKGGHLGHHIDLNIFSNIYKEWRKEIKPDRLQIRYEIERDTSGEGKEKGIIFKKMENGWALQNSKGIRHMRISGKLKQFNQKYI